MSAVMTMKIDHMNARLWNMKKKNPKKHTQYNDKMKSSFELSFQNLMSSFFDTNRSNVLTITQSDISVFFLFFLFFFLLFFFFFQTCPLVV